MLLNKHVFTPKDHKNRGLSTVLFSSLLLMTSLPSMSALAVCDISPDNRYESIESIIIDSVEMSDGAAINSNSIIELTPGYASYQYKEYWSIWIDLNSDGDFADSDELAFRSSTASKEMVTATMAIAEGISLNNTQFRVLVHPDPAPEDSCGYQGYGEARTFSVSVNLDTDPGQGNGYTLDIQPNGGDDEHIANVELAGVNYSSGDDGGYGDYVAINSINISDGDSISLTPVTRWSTNWSVWIDSDSNHLFDSDELVFSGSGVLDTTVTGSLNLSGILVGTARMRVAMNGDGIATATGFRYGEIEDYSVNVQAVDNGTDPTDPTDPIEPEDKLYGSHVQWLHDSVKVKIFRFEFTDVELSWSMSRIESEMDEIVQYFDNESFGRFAVNYEIYDQVIQVNDKKSVWDAKDPNDWKAYFAEQLLARGETQYSNITDDTIYLILVPQISDWGIKAGVNPGAIRLYDTGDQRSQAGGIAHEMGHAMGLHHAQGLDGQDSVFGVGDYDTEMVGYGNAFSLMGNNAWDFGGLNLYYKNFFKSWNIADEAPEVSESGTYRIYALDQGEISGDIGIRLKAGNDDVTYWIEYRTRDGADTEGVLINTEGYFPDDDARSYYYGTSFLLDMTPNTHPDDINDDFDDFDDFMDGALVIGNSYADKWGAFTITPTKRGGTLGSSDAWVEVSVEMH